MYLSVVYMHYQDIAISPFCSIVGTGSIIFVSLISGQMTNSDVRLLLSNRSTLYVQYNHKGRAPSHPLPAQVHPIFMLSVADFFVATMWLIGAAVTMVNPAYIEFCYFSGILTTVRSTKHHATHGLYIVAPHNLWAIYSSTTQPMGYV